MKIKQTTYIGARKKVEYVDVPDPKPATKPVVSTQKDKNKSDKKADA